MVVNLESYLFIAIGEEKIPEKMWSLKIQRYSSEDETKLL